MRVPGIPIQMSETPPRIQGAGPILGRDTEDILLNIGYTHEDLEKPVIGVAHSWIETMPCNFNHRELAGHVKTGVRAGGS